jgi:hypothetical protein
MGLFYYKVEKDGVVTDFQEWLRGWKEHKITEYDNNFQECLHQYKRKEYDLAQEYNRAQQLSGLKYQPLVISLKVFGCPQHAR